VAIGILLQFCTTYLCEQSFSSLLLIINDPFLKDIDGELLVALSNIEPNVQRGVPQNFGKMESC